jgi:hypothetical protein
LSRRRRASDAEAAQCRPDNEPILNDLAPSNTGTGNHCAWTTYRYRSCGRQGGIGIMGRSGIEYRARRVAAGLLAVGLSAVSGVALAAWAVDNANGFYMAPVDGYRPPAYARNQPVAESFWQNQDGRDARPTAFQAATISTATSAQPAYRSASGS